MRTVGQIIYGKNAAKHSNNGKSFRQAMADAGERTTAKHAVRRLGTLGHRIAYDTAHRTVVLGGQSYPVTGARAEVSDFRSGLAGRKHTTGLTITLASGQVLTWHETHAGAMARLRHNEAVAFAAAVNTAAARPASGT